AAAVEAGEVGVGPALHHPLQLGGVEEALLELLAAERRVALRLAVDQLLEALDDVAFLVVGQQLVPPGAPGHLDDVPAGAAEDALELLDDLAVAEHGAVKALQVAVDDPDEVVEVRARRHADGDE